MRKAYTLIELLCVIAIISLLCAILFAVFVQVKNKSQQTTCLENEKTLYAYTQMYLAEYDEHFPTQEYVRGGILKDMHDKYHNDKVVCPSLIVPVNTFGVVGYALNGNLVGFNLPLFKQEGASLSQFKNPSRTICWYEEVPGIPFGQNREYYEMMPKPKGYVTNTKRHLGGYNFIFIDGHAKWFKSDMIEPPYADFNATNKPTFQIQ